MESAAQLSPDPLGYQQALPLTTRLYPFGCAVDLATNSPDVLQAVQSRWAGHEPLFDRRPVTFNVIVSPELAGARPTLPTFRARDHLVILVSDSSHFGCCDLAASVVACWVAADTARRPAYLSYHYLDSLLLILLSEHYFTPIHAGCVAWNGRGILLSGRASAGKTCLSYACARAGWTLISDDAGYLIRDDPRGRILGRPRFLRFEFSAGELFPELQGLLALEATRGEAIAEVDSSSLPGIKTATECIAEAIVFLERRAAATATLTAMDENEAMKRLLAELPVATQSAREAQIASLPRLVRKGAYRLDYEQLDDALAKLAQLAERG